MLVGHEALRAQLEDPELAPVVLIEGPDGIGKKLVAREVAEATSKPGDVWEVGVSVCSRGVTDSAGCPRHTANCDQMTTSVAEWLVGRFRMRSKGVRTVLFDAGRGTGGGLNALLKLLEEPPPKVRFIMWASVPVLPTVVSRAVQFRAMPLSDSTVTDILVSRGVPPERASLAAKVAAGRVSRAAEADALVSQRGTVIQLMKAAAEDDQILLANACRALQPQGDEEYAEIRSTGDIARGRRTVELFRTALLEARTGAWSVFSPSEVFGLETLAPSALDTAIRRTYPGASSVLVCRSVCGSLSRAIKKAEER